MGSGGWGKSPEPRAVPLPPQPATHTFEPVTGPHPRYRSLRQWWNEDDAAAAIIAAGIYLLGYTLVRVLWWGGPHVRDVVMSLYYLPVYLVASALAWRASRHPALGRGTRRGWVFFAAAALCIFANDATATYFELVRHDETSHVWIDCFALSAYPLWVAGLLAFPVAPRARDERAKFGFDVATVLVGGTMLTWYLALRPTALAASSPWSDRLMSVAFPVADLVLVLAAATILGRAPAEGSRRALQIFVVGAVAQFVADLIYGHLRLVNDYRTGDVIDAIWLTAGLSFAVAARVQDVVATRGSARQRLDPALRPSVTLLPYFFVVAGVALLLYVSRPVWGQPLGQIIVGTLALTTLVVMRQVIAARENVRLIKERMRQDARFRSLVQNASDLITVVNASHQISYQSPSIARLFGHQPSELEGMALSELIHPDDAGRVQLFLHRTIAEGGSLATVNWRMWHRDGNWRSVESIGMNLLHDSSVRGIVLNTRDVSDRTALEAELTHQAFHDPLTGLANRALLRDRTEHALTRSQRGAQSPQALLFLDLDNFKMVNDSLGHAAGDSLLVEAARRLLACVRASDTVARLGGDEFAVFIEDPVDDAACIEVAERIIAALARPFAIGRREVFVGASLGIATARDGDGADGLLRNADMAMYLAKTRGKGRYERFVPEMHVTAIERIELESDLRHAIENGDLLLHYQPIVLLETGDITGVEALVRWQHPRRGLLPPGQFIGLAEETGMILPLGAWVLREACVQGQRWRARRGSGDPLAVTVNVSGRQIQNPQFIADVRAALSESGLMPHALILELTESVLTTHTETVQATLQALKAVGVRLAIDDFGTGYSSLSYLQRFPIDILKIAKPFIDDVAVYGSGAPGVGNRRALAQAVITLGTTLSVRTIAEGIELPQQLDRLRELGCDLGQGYHFSRPVPANELESLLFGPGVAFPTNGRAARGRRSAAAEPL
jgi:diguanylate cyclase (GGDEF)-like protein/PAS domain S-box-containing protein